MTDDQASSRLGKLTQGTAGTATGGSRRTFLRRVVGGGLAVGAASALAGCEHDTSVNPTPNNNGSLPQRRSIASLQQSDPNNVLQAFEDGVDEMKNNLSTSDNRHWDNIAEIHGTTNSWGLCRHGNPLFLPWHRAYIAFFEDIIRELSGNEDFALPYWNWAANPQLPSIFTDTSSSLYHANRSSSPHADGPSTDQSAVQSVLNEGNFYNFTSDLENPPHGQVHVDVGGFNGDMRLPSSASDPVFWTHHCTVDCIWWEWNWGQGNPNPNASSWTDTAFNDEFYDRNGDSVSEITVQDTLYIPLESHAFYEVGDKGTEGGSTPEDTDTRRDFIEEGAEVEVETEAQVPLDTRIEVPPRELIEIPVETERLAELEELVMADEEVRLQLTFRDMITPARSGAPTRVFVDQPEPIVDAPREDPQFAGSLAFFVAPESDIRSTQSVNVTDVFRRTAKERELFDREEFSFQLASVPDEELLGDDPEGQTFVIEELAFEVTRSFIGDHPLKGDDQERTDDQ